MIIPVDRLDADTLDAIIDEFILREGTDYGLQECSHQQKARQIKEQLLTGRLVVVFSEAHETVNIMLAEQFQQGYAE
ncbi:YheU family protein [Thalassotalea mangrovi]|uniref:YheU family protein n=1 Tax=Thalassotalea mangrovi TaxID=2572245 RepID=A0A4U1B569_9GAMM|nr:YheU family protein [Thalassotalea mangrovi]TKB45479.1 YheU family protein [Thalassotalea mangrovi]